jgi:tRNA1(Val) A37 N6-methylase TrmN6
MDDRAQRLEADEPSSVALEDGETLDSLFHGELRLIQRRQGYRFSVDPLLLAAWTGRPCGRAVDLGTGCGILPVLLALRGCRSVVGVEVQQRLYELAARNVALNGRSGQVELVHADLRALRGLLRPSSFDLVVSNPPYIAARAGNLNSLEEKAIARHELLCSLPELAAVACGLLRQNGSFKLVFPAARLPELFRAFSSSGLSPRRMRLVLPLPGRPAKMVLFEAVRASRCAFEALPPLYLFSEPGAYTDQALQILEDLRANADS